MPASNPALLTYLFQVLAGQQSLPEEVGTPGRVKRDALPLSCGQEASFADNGRKRRNIIRIDFTGSDHDEGALFGFTGSFIQLNVIVTDHLPACHDKEVSINDRHDVEHTIMISD